MSTVTRNLKLLWRSEQILADAKIGLLTRKLVLGIIAGIACLFALGMFNIAMFFAFETEVGRAWAGLIVSGLNVVAAIVLALIAQNLKPAPEEEMVREVRDIALAELGSEVEDVQAKLHQLRDDVQSARDGITKFVNRPMDVFSPSVIGAAVTTISKLVKNSKS